MSDELEALQKLRDLVEHLTRIDYVPTDLRNEVKELLINSYKDSNGYFSQIEEALKRNEPKKVEIGTLYDFYPICPNCKNELNDYYKHSFCKECGQRLDWSKKNGTSN